MINKKFILGIMLGIFLIGIMSAVGEVSYCCEKTTSGAWCQNAPKGECHEDYRKVPTSCESTSYCKLGCCYNSKQGTCMENTPQIVCQHPDKPKEEWGIWEGDAGCDIPQCQLGCCLIGEQAAFVTKTRCKALSSLYGLKINYRTDIGSEMQCIASAVSDVKGACVFEKEYQITCLFSTKKECQEMGADNKESGVEFHEGYLCSAEELGTNCAMKGGTTCVEGEDEVYFLDTCGNLANVYDSEKLDDDIYWTYIASYKDEINVCNLSSSNSKTCGNCDYYGGSTCKAYKKGAGMADPSYGNYVCQDLGCVYEEFELTYGRNPKHGETWCAEAKGVSKITIDNEGTISSEGEDLPGGRYFRLVCYNGEVNVEPCADFRQEICIASLFNEGTSDEFSTASCRVNMWQDCYSQDNLKDCNNSDRRDCEWIEGNYSVFNILKEEEGEDEIKGACVPLYAPGFDFWDSEGDAESICSMANAECLVTYEQKLKTLGVTHREERKVIANEKCYDKCTDEGGKSDDFCEEECTAKCVETEDDEIKEDKDGNSIINKFWKEDRNYLCKKLGDCGNGKNAWGIQSSLLKDIIQIKKVGEEEKDDED